MVQMQNRFSGLVFADCRKAFSTVWGRSYKKAAFHIEAARFEAARFHFPPQRQNAGVCAGQKADFFKPFRPRSLAPVSARRSDGR